GERRAGLRRWLRMGIKGKTLPCRAGALASTVILAAIAAACADLPRDPEGTTERVRHAHEIVLGEVAGAPLSPGVGRTLDRVAARLDPGVETVSGHGEDLLGRLEKGEVDLVYGHFAASSPWAARVHFGTPLGSRRNIGKDERVPRFAFRNGENGWIALVERATR